MEMGRHSRATHPSPRPDHPVVARRRNGHRPFPGIGRSRQIASATAPFSTAKSSPGATSSRCALASCNIASAAKMSAPAIREEAPVVFQAFDLLECERRRHSRTAAVGTPRQTGINLRKNFRARLPFRLSRTNPGKLMGRAGRTARASARARRRRHHAQTLVFAVSSRSPARRLVEVENRSVPDRRRA